MKGRGFKPVFTGNSQYNVNSDINRGFIDDKKVEFGKGGDTIQKGFWGAMESLYTNKYKPQ